MHLLLRLSNKPICNRAASKTLTSLKRPARISLEALGSSRIRLNMRSNCFELACYSSNSYFHTALTSMFIPSRLIISSSSAVRIQPWVARQISTSFQQALNLLVSGSAIFQMTGSKPGKHLTLSGQSILPLLQRKASNWSEDLRTYCSPEWKFGWSSGSNTLQKNCRILLKTLQFLLFIPDKFATMTIETPCEEIKITMIRSEYR